MARIKLIRKAIDLEKRDFSGEDGGGIDAPSWWNRRVAVCKRCGLIISDSEPSTRTGEFYHKARPYQTRARRCQNAGKVFMTDDLELEPFMKKAQRRRYKRLGIRA